MTKKLAAALALAVALGAGCTTNLQGPYVAQMELTHKAIMLDVDAGLYKPDAKSEATLAQFERSNAKARAALEASK